MYLFSNPAWCEDVQALEHVDIVFDQLRDKDPCHWNSVLNGWLVTRADDVQILLQDETLSADACQAFFITAPDGLMDHFPLLGEFFRSWMVFCDPPLHTELRSCFKPAMGALPQMRAELRTSARTLLSSLSEKRRVSAYAYVRPYAIKAAAQLLCIKPDEFNRVSKWSDHLLRFIFSARPERYLAEGANESLTEMMNYIDESLLLRTETSMWVAAMAPLPPLTRAAAFTQILTGSYEPVASALVVGLYHLLNEPNQRSAILSGEVSWNHAVEETLRWCSPFRLVPRVARNRFVMREKNIQSGDRLLLLIAAANRDPAVYENPHCFSVTRNIDRQVAFGLGRHYCLGAQIARLQIAVGLASFFEEHPKARLTGAPLRFVGQLGAAVPMDYEIDL